MLNRKAKSSTEEKVDRNLVCGYTKSAIEISMGATLRDWRRINMTFVVFSRFPEMSLSGNKVSEELR